MVSSSTSPNDTMRSRRRLQPDITLAQHNNAKRPTVQQSWSSFLIQHQLILSCSLILAIFAAHVLTISKNVRDGHSVDWIATLTAIIPPPIWQNLPQSWTKAGAEDSVLMSEKWSCSLSEQSNPHATWTSLALALQYQDTITDEATGTSQVVYGKGWNDFCMVAVWVLIWTALREAAMTYFFFPLGRYFRVGEKAAGKNGGGSAPRRTKAAQQPRDASHSDMDLEQRREQGQPEGKLLRFAEQGNQACIPL